MANNYQRKISEQLQLLHELSDSDLNMPYQAAVIHSNKEFRDIDTNRHVRLLDTIAVEPTTGNPRDVFAAASDKRERMQLILAKNGPPTSEDIAAANELISLMGSSVIEGAQSLGIRNLDREDVAGIIVGNQTIELERVRHGGY